eukprot:9525310-Ditylum_brightwellii.AAC.2
MFAAVTNVPFISGLTVAAKFAMYICGITCGWGVSKNTGRKPFGIGMTIGGVLGGMCCSGSGNTSRGGISFFLGTLGSVLGCVTVCCINTLVAGTGTNVGAATGASHCLLCSCFDGMVGNCAGACRGLPSGSIFGGYGNGVGCNA